MHLHKPANTQAWGGDKGNSVDCAWDNCVVFNFIPVVFGPTWFDGINPPDPNDSNYCHAETNNIDFPPKNQWIRLGVHYYSNHGETYDVHPKVRIFCDAKLVSTLGDATADATGFSEEVTFPASGGDELFWLVADVPYLTTVTKAQTETWVPYPDGSGSQMIFDDDIESGDSSAWPTTFPNQ